jgi:cell wall assembly regulator SMI1
MSEAVDTVIDDLEKEWDFEDPATPADLTRAEQALGRPLPEPLAAFYRRADGAEIGSVDVFTTEEFSDVNKHRAKAQAGAVFFASDGADGFFLLDVGDRMKKGKGAIFWTDRSDDRVKRWVYNAADFSAFLRIAASGKTSWSAPSLGDVDLAQMIDAVKRHPDRWVGRAPAEFAAIRDAGVRVNVLLPQEIEELMEISNGFEFPASEVTVYGVTGIEPVPGTTKDTGRPGALWFAEDRAGVRYALTTIGWRDSEGGEVVRVGHGESPDAAPIIGSLPAAVVAWLEGKAI